MLDVAIIGLGWWGKILTQTLAESSKIRVTRLFDLDEQGRKFADEAGVPFAGSFEEVLGDDGIDAVILATPHSFHESQIIAVSGAGKHVFCEKPLCLNRDSALRAIDAVTRSGVKIGIGHERRYEPPIMDAMDMARAGELGKLMHVEANFSHDIFVGLQDDNWRLDSSESPAGGLTATLIHLTDLCISLFGQPERVAATCECLGGVVRNGDTLVVHVGFEGGRSASLCALTHTPFFARFAIFGSSGWTEIRDKAHVQAPEGAYRMTCLTDGKPETVEYGVAAPVLANLEAFADDVAGTSTYPNTPDQMVMNVSLLEAITRSVASGEVVEVER